MLQQVFTCMYSQFFFSPSSKEGGCFTNRQTNINALLFTITNNPPSPELKVTAPFLRGQVGGLPQLALIFHKAKLFFFFKFQFWIIFIFQLSQNVVFEQSHFSGPFQKILNPRSSPGRRFQAYHLSKPNLKTQNSSL